MNKWNKAMAIALAMGCATSALAYDEGDIVFRAGAAMVDPDGDGALNGALDVDDDTQLGLTLTYMITDNLGLGVLASTPFSHDIELNGTTIGDTKHLPPTITLQYHFDTGSSFHPYSIWPLTRTGWSALRSGTSKSNPAQRYAPVVQMRPVSTLKSTPGSICSASATNSKPPPH